VLAPFHAYLEDHKIKLASVKIEQLDAFLVLFTSHIVTV
jgi:hypothetical protein